MISPTKPYRTHTLQKTQRFSLWALNQCLFSTAQHKLATAVLTCMVCLAEGILGRKKTQNSSDTAWWREDARTAVFMWTRQKCVLSSRPVNPPRKQRCFILARRVAPLVNELHKVGWYTRTHWRCVMPSNKWRLDELLATMMPGEHLLTQTHTLSLQWDQTSTQRPLNLGFSTAERWHMGWSRRFVSFSVSLGQHSLQRQKVIISSTLRWEGPEKGLSSSCEVEPGQDRSSPGLRCCKDPM